MGDLKLYVKIGEEFQPVAAVIPSFGIVKKIQTREAPYGLRHSFAERLAKSSVSPFYIQILMGHSDIKTTMAYMHDDKNNLKNVMDTINYE